VTEVTVRLTPTPPIARASLVGFASIEDAGRCVSAIISAGLIPAAMEIMDRFTIDAVENYCAPGYPPDAAAILIVEIDGIAADVARMLERIERIAREVGATSFSTSSSEAERQRIWMGRKAAFAASGRIAPDMLCMDGTIPRRELPRVLGRIGEMAKSYGLPVANVFHAGDGNLHPLIMYDVMKDDDLANAERFGADILKLCVEA